MDISQITDEELKVFIKDWWRGFIVYHLDDAPSANELFDCVDTTHFVHFLRDALIEFQSN